MANARFYFSYVLYLFFGWHATESKAQFSSATIVDDEARGVQSVYAADMDGDGDLDVLSALFDRQAYVWYPNLDGQGTFGEAQFIASGIITPRLMHTADIDGDGDLDVLAFAGTRQLQSRANLRWYRNDDGGRRFERMPDLYTEEYEAGHITTGDLDNDGDLDVLFAGFWTDVLLWCENTDGLGTFGPAQEFQTAAQPAFIGLMDVDQDGDTDVVGVAAHDRNIVWFEQTSPGHYDQRRAAIDEVTGGLRHLDAQLADINRDGLMDMVTGAGGSEEVAWFAGTGTAAAFGPKQSIGIASGLLDDIEVTDLDGDGDQDVLSVSQDGILVWYANTDGAGTFSSARVLVFSPNSPPNFVQSADLDADGDMDILTSSTDGQLVLWYANDGIGVHVDPNQEIPNQLLIERVYPNPFSERLSITVHMAQSGSVQVDVFDVLGRHIAQLEDGVHPTGALEIEWQPLGIPDGVYVLRVLADGQRYSLPVVRK
ncbi:MAG: hypothetical protein RhofKO_34540 [Rhodothermales bacterium]